LKVKEKTDEKERKHNTKEQEERKGGPKETEERSEDKSPHFSDFTKAKSLTG
jgi:hypothetical protein